MIDALRSPWLDRLDRVLERISATEPLHVDRIMTRSNPPSVAEFVSELMRRAEAGEIDVFYRVSANEGEDPITDVPFKQGMPEDLVNTETGEVRDGAAVDIMVRAHADKDSQQQ